MTMQHDEPDDLSAATWTRRQPTEGRKAAPERWQLHRAGILNVYQYGDEVLHFGGGRLLLRGVNGSGKSTAMNMLLPFLLDAETRKIDAAGVQQGVLRAWMLTGREEQQPVGYLWLELARPRTSPRSARQQLGPESELEFVVFGCGIRANRSTDNVTTWWFITDRRPHIDVNLIDGRTPRSIDSLREALGPGSSVFTKDQRSAYRGELRARLFGGADLHQHIALLHTLRNPAVGDRVDANLHQYLDDALPQLSEQAIDDAAQPLEDLEEHRRNVAQLSATFDTVSALATTYAQYCRGELRGRAASARAAVEQVVAQRRRLDAARRATDSAGIEHSEARAEREGLDLDVARLRAEIDAMKSLPTYAAGQNLEELRKKVRVLHDNVLAAARRAEEVSRRLVDAKQEEFDAAALAAGDLRALTERLSDLARVVEVVGVPTEVAGPPQIDLDAVELPSDAGAAVDAALGAVRAGLDVRKGDVDQVEAAISALESAEAAVDRAASTRATTEADLAATTEQLAVAARVVQEQLDELLVRLHEWSAEQAELAAEVDPAIPEPPTLTEATDLLGNSNEIHQARSGWASRVAARIEQGVAESASACSVAAVARDEASVRLDELLARSEPDPPLLEWQSPADAVLFAQLVDFAEGVPVEDRVGYEAAMEAAGLLGASVRAEGLELASGELLAVGSSAVDDPLSEVLVVTVPSAHAAHVDPAAILSVLRSVSTSTTADASTVVSADGSFRVGALRGRHSKAQVEHVGATARLEALERARQAARDVLEDCQTALGLAEGLLAEWTGRRARAGELLGRLPSTRALDAAVQRHAVAEETVEHRREALAQAARELLDAESVRDERDDVLRRRGATLRLPRTRSELVVVRTDLGAAREQARQVADSAGTLDRSIVALAGARRRRRAIDAELVTAVSEHEGAVESHDPEAAQLATAEDSLGADYQELIEALALSEGDLAGAKERIPAAQDRFERSLEAQVSAQGRVAAESGALDELERASLRHLDTARAVLAVPGLALAVWSDPVDESAPTSPTPGPDSSSPSAGSEVGIVPTPPVVERSSSGVAQLADWLERYVPEPIAVASAESVRMSLRQRRNALGAGWDAEDRQPDDRLPLSIEVNGPEGRMQLAEAAQVVGGRLRQQRGLLDAKQADALRNLLQGLIAKEVASKLHAARELVELMNARLRTVETTHGIRVSLTWRRREDLDEQLGGTIELMSKPPDLRTLEEDLRLIDDLSRRIDDARVSDPEASYRELITEVLDYRHWHEMRVMLHRPGQSPQRLGRRTALSEGEKKVVSYLPLFAAVAASCDALAEHEPSAPRFVLLDDAFAKVSADNHAKLFGLLVDMDLDFIATSERLWGTHSTVPELAITEVVRDADAGVILLEHARWDGASLEVGFDG